jgi:hypothetical protein
MQESCTYGSGAARLAAIPAGASPANTRSPVHVVVIPSGREGRAPESQVRTRLPAGGNRIRTIGPAAAKGSAGRCQSGRRHDQWNHLRSGPRSRGSTWGALLWPFRSRRDRWFESGSLRRGVRCEPDFRGVPRSRSGAAARGHGRMGRWPPDMPEFRAATTAYYAAMEVMATRLVPIVAMALDLPPDYFAEAFAQPNCTIRLIHYPPHPDPEDNRP